MTYFHGGVPGLRLGASILPPSMTGRADSIATIGQREFADRAGHLRNDRVFLGSREVATLYAAMYPAPSGGWIYEVEATEPVEPDPDYLSDDGASVQSPSAVIVRVWGPLERTTVEHIRRVLVPA